LPDHLARHRQRGTDAAQLLDSRAGFSNVAVEGLGHGRGLGLVQRMRRAAFTLGMMCIGPPLSRHFGSSAAGSCILKRCRRQIGGRILMHLSDA